MQLALPLPNHKNGHGRRERAADLKGWLGDLDSAEAVYRHAKARGVTPIKQIYRVMQESGCTRSKIPDIRGGMPPLSEAGCCPAQASLMRSPGRPGIKCPSRPFAGGMSGRITLPYRDRQNARSLAARIAQ
jgi:hypothetical protein